jgi:hypothetical protein
MGIKPGLSSRNVAVLLHRPASGGEFMAKNVSKNKKGLPKHEKDEKKSSFKKVKFQQSLRENLDASAAQLQNSV